MFVGEFVGLRVGVFVGINSPSPRECFVGIFVGFFASIIRSIPRTCMYRRAITHCKHSMHLSQNTLARFRTR